MVEDTLVEATAMRLVLAVCAGGRPRNVRAGTIMIPPPTPSIEPRVPAPRPTAMRITMVMIGSSNYGAFLCEFSVITGEGKIPLPRLSFLCIKVHESSCS
jgi:hypothetical protein